MNSVYLQIVLQTYRFTTLRSLPGNGMVKRPFNHAPFSFSHGKGAFPTIAGLGRFQGRLL